ncbi:MAG: hypothetical protein WAM03_26590, partial [Pseudolabrys sp.]
YSVHHAGPGTTIAPNGHFVPVDIIAITLAIAAKSFGFPADTIESLAAPHAPEPPASWPDYFSVNEEEAHMPAIIIPVLWVGGAAILLGGGWHVIGPMVH